MAEDTTQQTTTTGTETTQQTTTTTTAPFYDGFSDQNVKTWTAAKGFKDPEALATSALNLEKHFGVPADQLLKLPKEMTPETMRPILERLGAGKSVDDYKLPIPDGQPDTFAKTAAGWMHKHGVPVPMAQELAKEWNAFQADAMKQAGEAKAQENQIQVQQLDREWGAAKDANYAVVDRAAKAFGMSEKQLLALKEVMGPAEAMKFLFNIGSKVAVDDSAVGMGNRNGMAMSREQALQRIAEQDGDTGWKAKYLSGDQAARNERARLNQIAFPG